MACTGVSLPLQEPATITKLYEPADLSSAELLDRTFGEGLS